MRTLQNKENDRHHTRAGTSITEALVSLVILALFIAGASKLILSHRQLSNTAQDHYTATTLAKNKLELIKTSEFSRRPDFAETDTIVNPKGNSDPLNGRFRRSTTISPVAFNVKSEAITYEIICQVDIRNRRTLDFSTGASETLRTYQSFHEDK